MKVIRDKIVLWNSIDTASKQHTKCRGTGRKSRQLILEEKVLCLAVDIVDLTYIDYSQKSMYEERGEQFLSTIKIDSSKTVKWMKAAQPKKFNDKEVISSSSFKVYVPPFW